MSTPSTKQTPTNKKIAKAAKAGGSRARSRTNISWSYWGSILGICALGMALIVGSVIGKSIAESAPFSAPTSKKLASANKDLQKLVKAKKPDTKKIAAATVKRDALLSDTHWHSAYGVYKCDAYLGKIVNGKYAAEIDGTDDTLYPDVVGIHAHDDGLIHIHPFVKRSAGRKALLGSFLDTVKAKITSKEISYQVAGKTVAFNVDKMTCGKDKKKPIVSVFVWRDIKKPSRVERYTADFKRIPLLKNGAYAFAITAPGSKTPPVPPSEKSLEAPVDVPVTTTIPEGTATTTVSSTVSSTVKAAAGAATTAPASGATTTAPTTVTPTTAAPTTAAPTTAAPTTAAPTTTKA